MTRPEDQSWLSRRALLSGVATSTVAHWLPRSTGAQGASTMTWERLAAEMPGPAPRWDLVLVADAARGRLLAFGGRDSSGVALGDTWAFDIDSATWSLIAGEQPAARFGMAATVDAAGEGVLLFGGQQADTFFNDTWRFDLALDAWELVDSGEGVAPSPRYGLGGVVDGTGKFIVSHGFTFEGRFDDTWAYDPAGDGWIDISPPADSRPLPRCLHEQVWDDGSGLMVLYAGCSSGFGPCPQGDTWTLDPVRGVWTDVSPTTGPDARSNPAVTVAPSGTSSVLFGGLTGSGYAGDTWIGTLVDGSFAWMPVQANGEAPSPRASHDMATLDGNIYVFGGTSDTGPVGELWRGTLLE